jgi:hypothetical protein
VDLSDFTISGIAAAARIPERHCGCPDGDQIRQGKDFRLSPFVDRAGAKRVKAISRGG